MMVFEVDLMNEWMNYTIETWHSTDDGMFMLVLMQVLFSSHVATENKKSNGNLSSWRLGLILYSALKIDLIST